MVEKNMIAPRLADAWSALASVPDPEIPVVSIVDLGIVRALARDGDIVLTMGAGSIGQVAPQLAAGHA